MPSLNDGLLSCFVEWLDVVLKALETGHYSRDFRSSSAQSSEMLIPPAMSVPKLCTTKRGRCCHLEDASVVLL